MYSKERQSATPATINIFHKPPQGCGDIGVPAGRGVLAEDLL